MNVVLVVRQEIQTIEGQAYGIGEPLELTKDSVSEYLGILVAAQPQDAPGVSNTIPRVCDVAKPDPGEYADYAEYYSQYLNHIEAQRIALNRRTEAPFMVGRMWSHMTDAFFSLAPLSYDTGSRREPTRLFYFGKRTLVLPLTPVSI